MCTMMTFSLTSPTANLKRGGCLKGSVSVEYEELVASGVLAKGKLVAIGSLRSFLHPRSLRAGLAVRVLKLDRVAVRISS